ncbi:hypothetical protein BT96DRAFT_54915 [Gymnopus androsaceus JB14]|uniref:FAD/NAD(P)-binding domain-containing protein n=1 Tax=Gymnopus androsaceus JB14 TaxID=1447944 RepID=A0A6A4I7D3_9AGAR|nr:hypothetical protein BT96DRAFT_54915 [Gymnopus androsaceus JB14]
MYIACILQFCYLSIIRMILNREPRIASILPAMDPAEPESRTVMHICVLEVRRTAADYAASRQLTFSDAYINSHCSNQLLTSSSLSVTRSTMALNLQGFPLPTLDRLGASLSPDVDAKAIASEWFSSFSACVEASDVEGVVHLFMSESYWRDILALTWDFRTFTGVNNIKEFLKDRLSISQLKAFKLRDEFLGIQRPFPDLVWISFMFDFEVGNTGIASGIGRLVPQADGSWKANCIFTNLEELKEYPEKVGFLRNLEPNHGLWAAQRQREIAFEDKEPTVLIIGGGQGGLEIAARLKMYDIPTLIAEKNSRIGDSWRNRYKALCLHDPVWYDHLAYLPFPPNWPAYSPAAKLAGWLEYYAEAMELNVWTSCEVVKSVRNEENNTWAVTLQFADGKERIFNNIKHLIFATGLSGNQPNMPSYPGKDLFKGQILHSSEHSLASDHIGKKVVVVGACTSAHDIASDYYLNGVDVTMYQRSSTYIMSTKHGWEVLFSNLYAEGALPTDIADRVSASFPLGFAAHGFAQRSTQLIAEKDKTLLEDLRKRGFKLNMGIDGTGFGLLAWTKASGYYLDVGASQMIIDGKIKLKNDSQLQSFTETGLKFEDGSEIPADVVVFATGFSDARLLIRKICGDDVANKCSPVWGLNEEGEIHGSWKDMKIPGLWYAMGNLAMDRFHSKHIALQIKAMEEKKFGPRYSLRVSS